MKQLHHIGETIIQRRRARGAPSIARADASAIGHAARRSSSSLPRADVLRRDRARSCCGAQKADADMSSMFSMTRVQCAFQTQGLGAERDALRRHKRMRWRRLVDRLDARVEPEQTAATRGTAEPTAPSFRAWRRGSRDVADCGPSAVEAPAVEGAFDVARLDPAERQRDAAMRTAIDQRAGRAVGVRERRRRARRRRAAPAARRASSSRARPTIVHTLAKSLNMRAAYFLRRWHSQGLSGTKTYANASNMSPAQRLGCGPLSSVAT